MVPSTGVGQCCQSAEGKEESAGRNQPFAPCESGKSQSPARALFQKGLQRPVVVVDWDCNARGAEECAQPACSKHTVQIWSLAFRAFFPG